MNDPPAAARPRDMNAIRRALAVVAVLFGIATLVAGGRVLLGADPGYVVYRPLLAYNTAMGAAYVAAGLLVWVDSRRATYLAAAIFVLNGLVLGAIAWRYTHAGGVAVESLRAMTLRTGVWLVLFLAWAWPGRRRSRP